MLAVTPSAQALEPSILDAGADESFGERLLVEVGPSARAGKGADVGEDRDSMLAEQFEKAFDRMRRMADCVKGRARRLERGFYSVRHLQASDFAVRFRAVPTTRIRTTKRIRTESTERRQRE